MQLRQLRLVNFRRFDDIVVDFDRRLTVIAARNGRGKTSVLEGAAAALGPFVGGFDEGVSGTLKPSDAHYRVVGEGPENEQSFPVVVDAQFADPELSSIRELRSGKKSAKPTTAGSKRLNLYGKELQDKVRAGEDVTLPVMCYYSSKRLWLMHRDSTRKSELLRSRTAGYQDCLSELSSFNQLHHWLRSASLAVAQNNAVIGRTGPYKDMAGRLRGISNAVDAFFADEGWSGFRYDLVADELVMYHPDHGDLPLSYLSDGVRAMATLTADLAKRCTQLNGHFGEDAPTKTPGIVLIDEVDLHLHPAWQQRVLGGLRAAFPDVQFIVSTHSPQVISTTDSSQIRVISQDGDGHWAAVQPDRQVVGRSSAEALLEVMDVRPTPPTEESAKVDRFTQMIETGRYDSAEGRELRQELESIYGAANPVILDINKQIRFRALKQRVAGRPPVAGEER